MYGNHLSNVIAVTSLIHTLWIKSSSSTGTTMIHSPFSLKNAKIWNKKKHGFCHQEGTSNIWINWNYAPHIHFYWFCRTCKVYDYMRTLVAKEVTTTGLSLRVEIKSDSKIPIGRTKLIFTPNRQPKLNKNKTEDVCRDLFFYW